MLWGGDLEWEVYFLNAPVSVFLGINLRGFINLMYSVANTNASVTVDGKAIVYSGILPICRDEIGLATVLSHEIAHVVASHNAELRSKILFIDVAKIPLLPWLHFHSITGSSPMELMIVFGPWLSVLKAIATWLSRQHESEADFIGLTIMAQAGYDIRKSGGFGNAWQKPRRANWLGWSRRSRWPRGTKMGISTMW
jgi:Zn-dependent protease with chaperone function